MYLCVEQWSFYKYRHFKLVHLSFKRKLLPRICKSRLIKCLWILGIARSGLQSRVGVIIDCPQKDLIHNLVKVILTSQRAVSEMANDDDVGVQMLGNVLYR